MMKRLTITGIVSVFFALVLMAGGCGKSEEKKEVHSKSETVTEHVATEHGHEAVEHAATEHGHEATPDKVRAATQAAHEAAMERKQELADQASGKVEKTIDTTEEDVSGAHETVKKKMLEGC